MASYSNKKNDNETSELASPPNVGSSHEHASQDNHEEQTIWWSEEYKCYVVNGILAPVPISFIPPQTGSGDEDESELNASREAGPTQQSTTSHVELSGRNQRNEGTNELLFKLFKFPDVEEQYLLEMHDVGTGEVYRYEVRVHMSNRKWKVSVTDLSEGNYMVNPVLEDPVPLLSPKKCPLALHERLNGWKLEKRMRSTGREDKFYKHRGKQFRTLADVPSFILYSSKMKELKMIP